MKGKLTIRTHGSTVVVTITDKATGRVLTESTVNQGDFCAAMVTGQGSCDCKVTIAADAPR